MDPHRRNMRLLAIDDFVLAEHGIAPGVISKKLSSRLTYDIRWRDGVAGAMYFGRRAEPATWDTHIQVTTEAARDALVAALAGDGERRLLARRDAESDELVVIDAAIRDIVDNQTHADFEITFVSPSSVLLAEKTTETSKSFASVLDQSMRLAVPGNAPTVPLIRITPTAQRAVSTAFVGWKKRRRYSVTNLSDEPLWRYPVRISLGSTAALVSDGKALGSGNDVRVWHDGAEVQRSLVGMNTADTHAWVIVPALAPGDTTTFDVVYGNPSAGAPPVLAYPNAPAFTLLYSTNALWAYPVQEGPAHNNLGTWYLSGAGVASWADFGVPGAWHPVLSFDNPASPDSFYQPPWQLFTTLPGSVQARFNAVRVAAGGTFDNAAIEGEATRNPYDGIAIHNPLGIMSLYADFKYQNYLGAFGALVILVGGSSMGSWGVYTQHTARSDALITIPPITYAPAYAPVKDMGMAVWPANRVSLPENTDALIYASSHTVLNVALDSTKLLIVQTEPETDIYELATEYRLGGGANRVPPYHALLIGNTRSESGEGTPRAAVTLAQTLEIDAHARTHEVWTADLVTHAEDLSVHAVRAAAGHDSGGELTEFHTSEWLPLAPPRTLVPNGDFVTGIGGWEADTTTAGMTVTRTHDAAVGGEQAGSLAVAITANTAGIGASAATLNSKFFAVNGRESVEVAAWNQTGNANLTPRLLVRFYGELDEDGDPVLLSSVTEADWTPAINAGKRRSFAAAVPERAVSYRIGGVVSADTAGATGTVNFDDFSLNDNELVVADVSPGSLDVDVLVQGRWL
jgi:hypothetical protein